MEIGTVAWWELLIWFLRREMLGAPSDDPFLLGTDLSLKYGGFHKCGYPKMDQNEWFIRENPIRMQDLGVSLF